MFFNKIDGYRNHTTSSLMQYAKCQPLCCDSMRRTSGAIWLVTRTIVSWSLNHVERDDFRSRRSTDMWRKYLKRSGWFFFREKNWERAYANII